MPQRAVISPDGKLVITYADGAGPHPTDLEAMSRGQVWEYDAQGGNWTNITPAGVGGPFGGRRVLVGHEIDGAARRSFAEHSAQCVARQAGQFGVYDPQIDSLRAGVPQRRFGSREERELQAMCLGDGLPVLVVFRPGVDNADGCLNELVRWVASKTLRG